MNRSRNVKRLSAFLWGSCIFPAVVGLSCVPCTAAIPNSIASAVVISAVHLPDPYAEAVSKYSSVLAGWNSSDGKALPEECRLAFSVLCLARDRGSIALISEKMFYCSNVSAFGYRPDGFRDYPVAMALINMDFLAVEPALQKYFEKGGFVVVPASLMVSLMSNDAAMAWVDDFSERAGPSITADQKERLRRLREVVRTSRDVDRKHPLFGSEVSKQPLIVQRASLIHTNLKLLQGKLDWNHLSPQALEAIAILGELRSEEAAEFLSPHLLVQTPAAPTDKKVVSPVAASQPASNGALSGYPIAAALAQIGLPSVEPILKQVAAGDEEVQTQEIAKLTLESTMPARVAVVFVNEAMAKEENELAKGRLQMLRDLLQEEVATQPIATQPAR